MIEKMARAQLGSGKVALFSQKKHGGLTYRIPALLYLPSESTFLAFAEERSSPRDEDAKFLVMRRGQKEGTSVQWGPQETLMMATLPEHRTINPCPVYEEKSGTVFLFFICVLDHVTEEQQIVMGRNAVRLCYVSSQDGGRMWSRTVDLTKRMFEDDQRNWATFAVGPGHGVQLTSGRLVIPAYAYYIHKRLFGHPLCCWTKPHCFIFYSDDRGLSWARGQLLPSLRTTECQVAEVTCQGDSNVLYINARNSGWDQCRVEAFSMDSGGQFQGAFLCRGLSETPHGCQGSVVSFTPLSEVSDVNQEEDEGESSHLLGVDHAPASLKSTKSWLIFPHPTSRHKRMDLGIYLNTSPLEKGCWKAPWVLNKGPSGYSDLAVCEEGKSLLVGCLFECGALSELEEIAFQLFSDADLLKNLRQVRGPCGPSGL
ncbi:sialidase-3-like isoform X2 [Rhineura floridana]|uniref:sialidase-3-like isoform X2 n=1 Tax=Rhineura floridana TaxID=261503 RepID=UPI002AC85ED8|nr:sialidase-3-like isoform X2 [Rhineura floridana]